MAKSLKDDEKYTKKIESINSAVTRIAKIVNGLKKFSRSNDQADRNPAFVADILREAIELISPKAKRDTVSIEISCKTESQILCDVLEIEQVIVNLVNNAIDAAKNTSGKWVKVRLYDQNEKIILQIEDSGRGLTKEVEAKLFQPFFTTKPVGEGTGLGLSICKGILDQHFAEIYFNKNFQHTCFEVVFEKLK
jgi:C4-dicarboxylate-specific signal transduction histidine kinase